MKSVSKEVSKDKALEQVLNDIEKQFGKGSIMKLGDKIAFMISSALAWLAFETAWAQCRAIGFFAKFQVLRILIDFFCIYGII